MGEFDIVPKKINDWNVFSDRNWFFPKIFDFRKLFVKLAHHQSCHFIFSTIWRVSRTFQIAKKFVNMYLLNVHSAGKLLSKIICIWIYGYVSQSDNMWTLCLAQLCEFNSILGLCPFGINICKTIKYRRYWGWLNRFRSDNNKHSGEVSLQNVFLLFLFTKWFLVKSVRDIEKI